MRINFNEVHTSVALIIIYQSPISSQIDQHHIQARLLLDLNKSIDPPHTYYLIINICAGKLKLSLQNVGELNDMVKALISSVNLSLIKSHLAIYLLVNQN